jgi:hypothetical protein
MTHSIDAIKVVKYHSEAKSRKIVTGSSSYTYENGQIVKKPRKRVESEQLTSVRFATEHQAGANAPAPAVQNTYKLNKSKIRKKIAAFFETRQAGKFCAFYTITFPCNTADYLAYKMFNTWLTKCRKHCELTSYIWVAERQKNGTIHFHMLTSTHMNIREANGYMAKTIDTQRINKNLQCNENILTKYNGIDVDNLYYSKRNRNKGKRMSKLQSRRKLGKYLTKYISKNNTEMYRLPWHCSRDISALFTTQIFEQEEINEMIQLTKEQPECFVEYTNEFYTIYLPKFDYLLSTYTDINKINDLLLEIYTRERKSEDT